MNVIKNISEMMRFSEQAHNSGKRIGFVPTMGALHQGHLSLLDRARQSSDLTVLSIYVNPTQFGPKEDFGKYPRPFESDVDKAAAAGCDLVFAPSSDEMYSAGYNTYVDVEKITAGLCGASRPGHFRGVATVVLKLFNIVRPDIAVFGQKDAQQVLVIKRMIQDLNLAVKLVIAPTHREPDGLAMSSRNIYLTDDERRVAPLLYRGLKNAQEAYQRGVCSSADLIAIVTDIMTAEPLLQKEYVELVDVETVAPVTMVSRPALFALACRTGESKTRLIDNIILGGEL